MDDSDVQKVKDYALKVLSYRQRSEKELRMKLSLYVRKHSFPDSLIDTVIDTCKRLEFIDDEKFASWWVSQRRSSSVRGDRVIEQELRGKGVSQEVIDRALKEGEAEEADAARILAQKKLRILSLYPKNVREEKIKQALLRRGFHYDVIDRIIDELT
jgi:regulatory protein